MAAIVSLSFPLAPRPLHHHLHLHHHRSATTFKPHQTPFPTPKHARHALLSFPKPIRYNDLALSSSTSDSSSSFSTSSPPRQDPFRTGGFLTVEELRKLQFLDNFSYYQELKSGSLYVTVMRAEEMDMVASLLAESTTESMVFLNGFVTFLGFLAKKYLIARSARIPHTATLVGFYSEDEGGELELAGTVEVCFDRWGANAPLPTPTPPKDSPYVCNMIVKKQLRRRGIGWHLLKASEELISHMSSSREVYLHCRMIDEAPFNMYEKAGYSIVSTENIFVLLTLQRRKHLMRKVLEVFQSTSDLSDSNEELPSLEDMQKTENPHR